tara:strand:- start:1415 stop:1885 length:471 start_codon:yes stop_codon:yes gene_type:complete
MEVPILLIGFFIVSIFIVVAFFHWLDKKVLKQQQDIYESAITLLNDDIDEKIKTSVTLSRAVSRGNYVEQLYPFFPEFPYHPSDVRFLGSPIDIIVFDGMADGDIKQIVIGEIKTGKSSMTNRQRQIKKAVSEGKVVFEQHRIKVSEDDSKEEEAN